MSQVVTGVDGLILLMAIVALALVPGDWQHRVESRLGDRMGPYFVLLAVLIILLLPILIPAAILLEGHTAVREFMRELSEVNRRARPRPIDDGLAEETSRSKRRMLREVKNAGFLFMVGTTCLVLAGVFFTKQGYPIFSRAFALYLSMVGIGVFRGVRFYVAPSADGGDDQLIR